MKKTSNIYCLENTYLKDKAEPGRQEREGKKIYGENSEHKRCEVAILMYDSEF
jgi:hypothetical protein